MDTIIVAIPRPNRKFEIKKACPSCGGDRTSEYFFKGYTYEGSHRLYCDQWKCKCGHIDRYAAIAKEGSRMPHNTPTTLDRMQENSERILN